MAVSKRLRYEILRRDNFACRYCGATAPDAPLRVDHVIPKALGGTDAPTNLVTACEPCNSGKTSSLPTGFSVGDVDQGSLRQAAALRRDAEQQSVTLFAHLYMVWKWAWGRTGQPVTDFDDIFFTDETHKVLACGLASQADLTEAAYRAGAQNATDISSYIGDVVRSSRRPASESTSRFLTCVEALAEWESEWDGARPDAVPNPDIPAAIQFINTVQTALAVGVQPAFLVTAATRAGRSLSATIDGYLTEANVAGGDA
ncbi:HNH endonuclease [Streptantibioticus silvisoli]|uniref:HNH endonuclease n=1 Tax=Streptantibioticus silvisoli TaxID=2705255 RepID=A0ABT6W4W9_9ACTN|nr:HNH endonuclease [Streptantibioticus silvisoli]MDI5965797.1 HNH endonuclease [Streptantibioticus silvisoli]